MRAFQQLNTPPHRTGNVNWKVKTGRVSSFYLTGYCESYSMCDSLVAFEFCREVVVVVGEVRVALLPIQLAYEPLAPLYANCRHGRCHQEEVDTGTFDKQYFCHSNCLDKGPN